MAKKATFFAFAGGITLLAGSLLLAAPEKVRVGGALQHANLISQVAPVYPAEAKQARIQGAVDLVVEIGKEGHVQNISVVSGPAELVKAAVDAVSQWVYKPTLLNGEPVDVETTVTVNFTLTD